MSTPDDSSEPGYAARAYAGSLPNTYTLEVITENGLYILKNMTLRTCEMFLQALDNTNWDNWEPVPAAEWALVLSIDE